MFLCCLFIFFRFILLPHGEIKIFIITKLYTSRDTIRAGSTPPPLKFGRVDHATMHWIVSYFKLKSDLQPPSPPVILAWCAVRIRERYSRPMIQSQSVIYSRGARRDGGRFHCSCRCHRTLRLCVWPLAPLPIYLSHSPGSPRLNGRVAGGRPRRAEVRECACVARRAREYMKGRARDLWLAKGYRNIAVTARSSNNPRPPRSRRGVHLLLLVIRTGTAQLLLPQCAYQSTQSWKMLPSAICCTLSEIPHPFIYEYAGINMIALQCYQNHTSLQSRDLADPSFCKRRAD